MRCFISIPINGGVRGELAKEQARLVNVRLVRPDQFHICLKFLGEVSESQAEIIKKIMDDVLSGISSFRIRVAGVGGFPTSERARVVWAGVSGDFSFQKELDNALSEKGFPKDHRQFKPHITLGRVKHGFVRVNSDKEYGTQVVDHVDLVKSVLTPAGPEYSIIHTTKLL